MATKKEPIKYKTESLLKSKGFASYQQDFARALLPDPEYTVKEAKEILNKFFDKKEGA
ncbi:hypothetical protein [Lacrimispora indolis]|uniref:hypothetical protein n=1 Tax=Lacrimispora indolis TaxID=69825 RepID=UPI0004008CD5|nr:hypothetical protein [[Clostridium] methoxybenzovorans]